MGPQHADGMDKIMGVFYKMGLTMSSILRNRQFFYANDATQHQLSIAYSKLVSVVVEMTISYVKKGKGKRQISGHYDLT